MNETSPRILAPLSRAAYTWLISCAVLVLLMVIVGGLTRLTESGLSIVEWKLITGILPPLTDTAWLAEFQAYQSSPQFSQINSDMTVHTFKQIFWLEYIHRLLGRFVGILFLAPLAYFTIHHSIPRTLSRTMFVISALVGLQGAVGWYMVQSGLVDVPMVSSYRLAFHLGLAVIIFGYILWTILSYRFPRQNTLSPNRALASLSAIVSSLIFIQILLGALVAGLDAGLTYNTFPLMDGQWFPNGAWVDDLGIRSLFESIPLVQFNHRALAFITLGAIVLLTIKLHQLDTCQCGKKIALYVTIVAGVQIGLGITTLLQVVPVGLASLHQTVAVILFGLCLVWHYALHSEQD